MAYLAILSVFFWHLFLISQGALQLKRRNAKDQQMGDIRQAVELTCPGATRAQHSKCLHAIFAALLMNNNKSEISLVVF